jgi:hypothetical protein
MASVHDELTTDTPVDSPSEYDELDAEDTPALFNITVLLHGKPIELPFHDENATIQDLSDQVAEDLRIPPANQKFLITPKTGLLKPRTTREKDCAYGSHHCRSRGVGVGHLGAQGSH